MPVSKFTPSCLSPTWTSKTLMFLGRYERTYAHRLPGTELRSRALRKLARAKASSTAHLAVLVHRVVKQVLIDYGKEVSRHYEHFEYDFTVDFPEPEKGLPPFLQDRLAACRTEFDKNRSNGRSRGGGGFKRVKIWRRAAIVVGPIQPACGFFRSLSRISGGKLRLEVEDSPEVVG
jgi:hypothetical protein